ncbi:hypothetical protein SAG0338_02085 [Streptococcus agalactiae GB00663]|nr:hypothetical protein SAG0338_02085 [Streptococcus agalactiae GB00663]
MSGHKRMKRKFSCVRRANKVGNFTIISNCGIVSVSDNKITQSYSSEESYPGTFFEIRIDVSNDNLYDLEEEEEFEW